MPTTISSKRYAQAAFEIALEQNKSAEWQSDLRSIAKVAQDFEFVSLIENPRLLFESKVKLTEEKLSKINPLALNFTYLLIAKGKLKSASQIADEFERLLDDYHGVGRAEVITAIPLDDAGKERLSQGLEALVRKKVIVRFQVDPNIWGGFVARIDDTLIDCSVRSKLRNLRKSLVETRK